MLVGDQYRKNVPKPELMNIFPALVLFSASAETGLKSLIFHYSGKPPEKTHNLNDLFYSTFLDTIRSEIKEKIEEKHSTDFDGLLERNSKAFVSIRYLEPEGGPFSPSFLRNFADAVRQTALVRVVPHLRKGPLPKAPDLEWKIF